MNVLHSLAFLAAGLAALWPSTLIHELGHAMVALRRARGDVVVIVGSPERMLAELHRGRLHIGLGAGLGGACFYGRAAERGDLWIALGGPLASLLAVVGAMTGLVLLGGSDAPAAPATVLGALAFVNALIFGDSMRPQMVGPDETNIGHTVPSDGKTIADHFGLAFPPPAPRAYRAARPPVILALAVAAIPAFTVDAVVAMFMLAMALWLYVAQRRDARAAPRATRSPEPPPAAR